MHLNYCLYTLSLCSKELVVVPALFKVRAGQCLFAEQVLARSVKYTISLNLWFLGHCYEEVLRCWLCCSGQSNLLQT